MSVETEVAPVLLSLHETARVHGQGTAVPVPA